ncbi:hypothetical protein J6590_003020 [Homalodisca vitripennis]|nr:hypothetical protein J6590_003020 [Homalodisca vitripennis]
MPYHCLSPVWGSNPMLHMICMMGENLENNDIQLFLDVPMSSEPDILGVSEGGIGINIDSDVSDSDNMEDDEDFITYDSIFETDDESAVAENENDVYEEMEVGLDVNLDNISGNIINNVSENGGIENASLNLINVDNEG